MPLARLAPRAQFDALLCTIAALISLNGCHSVPVARADRATAVAATNSPAAGPSALARAQSGDRDRLFPSRNRLTSDEASNAPSAWGHVGESRTARTERAVRSRDISVSPRSPPESAVFANRSSRLPEADEFDTHSTSAARRRLDLMPPPTSRMALTDFSDRVDDRPEPDWTEQTPSYADTERADLDTPPPDSGIDWRNDARDLFPMLWDDTVSLFNWRSALALGAAAGGAIAIRENLDDRVRDHVARNPLKWGEGSEVLRQFGEFSYQVPVIAGVYGLSLWTQDDRLHEFSLSLISAYTLSSAATVAVKGITNTQRPTNVYQDGEYGFPSFHTSSTFSIAAVADEYFGWKVGIPAYVLAGMVGWSRIDQQEHDLSDVFFGACLGFVVGKTVSAAHIERHTGLQVMPYYDPVQQTGGVQFEKRY